MELQLLPSHKLKYRQLLLPFIIILVIFRTMCIVLITNKSDISDRYFIECQNLEEAKRKAEPYRVDSYVRIYKLGELVG